MLGSNILICFNKEDIFLNSDLLKINFYDRYTHLVIIINYYTK